MLLRKGQLPIFAINVVSLIIFIIIFIIRGNYEFFIYVGVIIFFLILVLLTNNKVKYSNTLLWGLTIWSLLHMSGGGLYYNGTKFYELMLLNIVGEPYNILKYDQVVHAFGFAIATFVSYHIISPLLKVNKDRKWFALSIVIVMAGLGFGALNEIVEFFVTVIVPETGVGGYENTALDLVFNFIGAIIAMIIIYFKESKVSKK